MFTFNYTFTDYPVLCLRKDVLIFIDVDGKLKTQYNHVINSLRLL